MTDTKVRRDGAQVLDSEQIAEAVRDYDGINYKVEARVDKFDEACFPAVRAMFGLPDWEEPKGAHLLEWAKTADAAFLAAVHDSIEVPGNLLTRLGRKRLMDRLFGTASNQAMDAAHLRIGTGNDATAAADTQTDLSAAAGAGNRQFQLCDSGVVGSGASSGVLTVVATFGTSVGNYAWQEWGLDGGTASGTTVTAEGNTTPGLFNRKVTSLGTKTSAASWVFTITITIT